MGYLWLLCADRCSGTAAQALRLSHLSTERDAKNFAESSKQQTRCVDAAKTCYDMVARTGESVCRLQESALKAVVRVGLRRYVRIAESAQVLVRSIPHIKATDRRS